ncbi:ankyrin repeat and SAM domain-containing protein 4B [Alligator sinensis]|uniref:Ankyrin repeat and SAM domain-containing protein 4B n=1 Tax=Alligator sinensis TaxID=38654 RepID=A0A1U7RYJ7_ALLSI|nr:ankyrin repeat and SAM domain-containing protein 4B [Alligator sinensis]
MHLLELRVKQCPRTLLWDLLKMSTRYHKAAADGNLDLLKEATKKDLNTSEEDGMTPTLLAAYHGLLEALEVICSRGGDPDKCDIWGNTPLHHAASNGHIHCLSFLIKFGANIFALDNDMRTPLDAAASRDQHECVRLLDKAATEQTIMNAKRVSKLKAQAQKNAEKQIKECEKRQEKHQHEMMRNYNKEKLGSVSSAKGTASRMKVPDFFVPNTSGTFSKSLKDTFRLKAKKKDENIADKDAQKSSQEEEGKVARMGVMDVFNEKDEDEFLNYSKGRNISEEDSQQEHMSIFQRPGLGKIVFGRNLAADINAKEMSFEKEGIRFKISGEFFQQRESENGSELATENDLDVPWNEEEIGWEDDEAESTPLDVFLASQNLNEFVPVFLREQIDLDALMLCSDEDLQSIQMQLGPRKRVLNAVDRRKQALQNPGKIGDTRL